MAFLYYNSAANLPKKCVASAEYVAGYNKKRQKSLF